MFRVPCVRVMVLGILPTILTLVTEFMRTLTLVARNATDGDTSILTAWMRSVCTRGESFPAMTLESVGCVPLGGGITLLASTVTRLWLPILPIEYCFRKAISIC